MTGVKSDILAVHLPTGRLGIVEFKSAEADLPLARAQVDNYGVSVGQLGRGELAPFFSDLLRAMGTAYGKRCHVPGQSGTRDRRQLFVGRRIAAAKLLACGMLAVRAAKAADTRP